MRLPQCGAGRLLASMWGEGLSLLSRNSVRVLGQTKKAGRSAPQSQSSDERLYQSSLALPIIRSATVASSTISTTGANITQAAYAVAAIASFIAITVRNRPFKISRPALRLERFRLRGFSRLALARPNADSLGLNVMIKRTGVCRGLYLTVNHYPTHYPSPKNEGAFAPSKCRR